MGQINALTRHMVDPPLFLRIDVFKYIEQTYPKMVRINKQRPKVSLHEMGKKLRDRVNIKTKAGKRLTAIECGQSFNRNKSYQRTLKMSKHHST